VSGESPAAGQAGALAQPKKAGRRWKVHRAPPHPDGLSYQDLRGQIRTGDLLLFRGNRVFSDAIERLSDSPYSHVAILARWNDRVIAFQADTLEPRYALFDGSNGQACQEMLETPPGTDRPDVVPWDGRDRAPAPTGAQEPAAREPAVRELAARATESFRRT
jgi:hypothetical protein